MLHPPSIRMYNARLRHMATRISAFIDVQRSVVDYWEVVHRPSFPAVIGTYSRLTGNIGTSLHLIA
jgi:hypothetical protein